MKILVIALSGIGDALMFSPALRLLRARHPNATIDLLSMFPGVRDMYIRNPDVSETIFCNFIDGPLSATFATLASLRKKKYDASMSVYPQNRWPYNLIARVIGAPIRIGHRYQHADVRSLNFLNTETVLEKTGRHNVEENVELVRLLGVEDSAIPSLQISVTGEDEAAAGAWCKRVGIQTGERLVGVHAGSATFKNQTRKRWSAEKYGQLGARIAQEAPARVLLFGGPEESMLNESIRASIGSQAFIVQTPSLMSSVALMKRCSVFVSNDSGLMHTAAALQIPLVAIFGYTNAEELHPWKTEYTVVRKDLACSPCFYNSPRPAQCYLPEKDFRCITGIGVEEVWQAVQRYLTKSTVKQ